MEYRITCINDKTGLQETIETDNIILIYSRPGDSDNVSWSAIQHIQASVVHSLINKLDVKGLIGSLIKKKFGGDRC